MFARPLEKLLFSVLLIVALQVPQLADHYRQFLSGLYQSTNWQVEGYRTTANLHEYPSVEAMIAHHLKNEVKSVRTDAQQKLDTLLLHQQLAEGVELFEQASLLEQAFYMFQPSRYEYLEKTLANYTLGIPLSIKGIAFGIIAAIVLNILLNSPYYIYVRARAKRQSLQQID